MAWNFLKLPAFGPLIKKSIYAKIAMVLANLLSAGVSIIEALEISGRVTENILVREAIGRLKDEILTGKVYQLYLEQNQFFQWNFQNL